MTFEILAKIEYFNYLSCKLGKPRDNKHKAHSIFFTWKTTHTTCKYKNEGVRDLKSLIYYLKLQYTMLPSGNYP